MRVLSVWGGVGWVVTLSTSSLAWCCAATCCLALRCNMLPYLIQGFAGATNCGKPPVESKEKILEVKDFDCISQLHSGQKNTCLLRCKVLPGNRISPQIYARCMLFSKNTSQKNRRHAGRTFWIHTGVISACWGMLKSDLPTCKNDSIQIE